MKNLFKRVAAVSLAAAVTLGLAGCNSNGDTGSSNNAGDSIGNSGNGGTLVIGGIGPTTGGAAQYGVAVKNGAQLAVDEINAAGGVNGITLKLDFQDDEHDAERSVNAYNTLKDKDMKLLVGTVTSAPCEAVSKEAAKDNMFLITPSGSSEECITAGDNCFRMCFTDPVQGSIAANYIADNMSARKIGIIYDSSDSYSTGIVGGFESVAKERGLEIVEKQAFTDQSKTDFSVQVQKIAEKGADMMFLPFYYTEAALVIAEMEKQQLDIPVFGGDGLDGLIDVLGDNVAIADGVFVMSPYASTSPEEKSAAFTKAYQEKFPNDPLNQFAADAYDCVYAIKLAMEKAGVNDASVSASELCDQMKAAMTQIELAGVTGNTKWAANGEPEKAPKVLKIVVKDGKGEYEVLS